ncbi:unnamed protein product, partial [Symbiodinium microadriaticum]
MDPPDPSTSAVAPSVAQFLQQAGITSQEEVANRLLAMQQQIDTQAQQQQQQSQVQLREAVVMMRALQGQLSDAMSRVQAAEQVDSKGVGQPFKYNGGADQDWSHKVTTYLKAKFGFEVAKALKWAVQQRKTIVEHLPGGALTSADGRQIAFDPVYGEQADEMDRILNLSKTVVGIYTYLIAFTTGDSNKIVRNAGSDAGLEAWRRLHNEYDPTSAMRRVTILGLVQNPPKCEKIENLGSALEDWLAKKRQYEVMFHSDEYDSFEDLYDLKISMIVWWKDKTQGKGQGGKKGKGKGKKGGFSAVEWEEQEGWDQEGWDGWWSSSWSEQPASEPPAKADQQAGGIGSLDLNHLANGKRRSFAAYATKVHKPLGSAAEFSSAHDCVLWAEGGSLIPKNCALAIGLRKEYYRLKEIHGECDELPLYREGGVYFVWGLGRGRSSVGKRPAGEGAVRWKVAKLVRYHVSLRRSLFSPHQASNIPVNRDLILGSRTTEAIFEDGSVETVEDDWSCDNIMRTGKSDVRHNTEFRERVFRLMQRDESIRVKDDHNRVQAEMPAEMLQARVSGSMPSDVRADPPPDQIAVEASAQAPAESEPVSAEEFLKEEAVDIDSVVAYEVLGSAIESGLNAGKQWCLDKEEDIAELQQLISDERPALPTGWQDQDMLALQNLPGVYTVEGFALPQQMQQDGDLSDLDFKYTGPFFAAYIR